MSLICRGYYRCTYRAAQGCQATKQVQRSDTDLCVFDVTYLGEHTCHQKQRHAAAVTAHGRGGSQSPPPPPPSHHEQQDPSMQLVVMGFKDSLKVETEASLLHQDHDCYDHGPASAPAAMPFSFPSVPPFHHHGGEAPDNNPAAAAFSPPGSSYFSAPPHHCPAVAGSYNVYDYEARPPGARMGGAQPSELGEVVSRATGLDYSSLYHHAEAEVDPHLPFPPFGGPSPSHGPYQ